MNIVLNSNDFHQWGVPAIESLFANDPNLRQFEKDIRKRYAMFDKTNMAIETTEGMERFTRGYKEFGIFLTPEGGLKCREWIPKAKAVYLSGEFNNWERWNYRRIEFGKWEMYIRPNADGSCRIPHLSELKLIIETQDQTFEKCISPWAKYVIKNERENTLRWLFWNPPRSETRVAKNCRPAKPIRLRIYEAHIGIASNRCEVASYRNFTSEVLPRVKDLGYNCVLLMAVMEHPAYASMGKQVSNFFASCSRFGTPEDLKELIDVAHGMGIIVMMDVVHNHAYSNRSGGPSVFEGGQGGYFEDDNHSLNVARRVKPFDFTKWEVIRFLLSNLRFYVDEFKLDGFRFIEIDSLCFADCTSITRRVRDHDDYMQHFNKDVDLLAMAYLMLANDMLHKFHPGVITIAEDPSEMPSLCRPVREGGVGFDYRLGLSVANKWMKLLDESRDEDWNMGFIFHALTDRNEGEKVIALTETHQQSMPGRQTLISKLIGEEISSNMSDSKPLTARLDRGLSLYKMFRMITHTLAGDGYMNFMGTEFGHPDYIEFPTLQNNNSYHYARRRFELCDDEELRFKYLKRFDRALNRAEEKYNWLSTKASISRKHESDKTFVFERAGLLFLFNFHPCQSYPHYRVGVSQIGTYKIILDTDDKYFGGHGRNMPKTEYDSHRELFDNRDNSLVVHLPSRCGIIMANSRSMPATFKDFHGDYTGRASDRQYDDTSIHRETHTY